MAVVEHERYANGEAIFYSFILFGFLFPSFLLASFGYYFTFFLLFPSQGQMIILSLFFIMLLAVSVLLAHSVLFFFVGKLAERKTFLNTREGDKAETAISLGCSCSRQPEPDLFRLPIWLPTAPVYITLSSPPPSNSLLNALGVVGNLI